MIGPDKVSVRSNRWVITIKLLALLDSHLIIGTTTLGIYNPEVGIGVSGTDTVYQVLKILKSGTDFQSSSHDDAILLVTYLTVAIQIVGSSVDDGKALLIMP